MGEYLAVSETQTDPRFGHEPARLAVGPIPSPKKKAAWKWAGWTVVLAGLTFSTVALILDAFDIYPVGGYGPQWLGDCFTYVIGVYAGWVTCDIVRGRR